MAVFYAIGSAAEARAYLAHPLLGPRLLECASALLAHEGGTAESILGPVDALKLRSSMTLFEAVADDPAPLPRSSTPSIRARAIPRLCAGSPAAEPPLAGLGFSA